MPFFSHHFTVTEARSELPLLRRQLARAKEIISELQARHVDLARVEKLVQSNGHGVKAPEIGAQVKALQDIVQTITERGIEIKDLARGLVDFPHWRDGEEVLLCYLDGEPDIEFWHTLEGGFGGRQPI